MAVRLGEADVVAALLKHRADPNRYWARNQHVQYTPQGGSRYGTLLSMAATRDIRMVEMLLNHGASVEGTGALHWAVCQPASLDTARLLMDRGTAVDEPLRGGYTPLQWAALRGSLVGIELLVKNGADANLKYAKGNTPLHRAALRGQLKAMEVLLGAGADPEAKN